MFTNLSNKKPGGEGRGGGDIYEFMQDFFYLTYLVISFLTACICKVFSMDGGRPGFRI